MIIKTCTKNDILALSQYDATEYFDEAFIEQENGKRLLFMAMVGDDLNELAGYVHYNRYPQYAPFKRLKIPEIQDLFVVPKFRRMGIGKKLIKHCESQAISENIHDIGIAVGVTASFGAAQRLYMRMGYVPDGAGIVFDREAVVEASVKPIDSRMCLMLVKEI